VTAEARVDGYLPIAGYGLIGDCRSAALVGVDGSIDWLCLPRFDDASILGRLLDARRGGHWQIAPPHPTGAATQRYRDRTNILQTVFTCPTGRVVVTDFMPIEARTQGHHARPHTGARLVRLVECTAGTVELRCDLQPAPDYGRVRPSSFRIEGQRMHGDAGALHVCVRGSVPMGGHTAEHRLQVGEALSFALSVSNAGECPREEWTVGEARSRLRITQDFWWHWAEGVRYSGPYQQPVWRSALALKLMTYAPTGAIVAAPTTSLPEAVGGVRNWDYRFTWLRDASFTLYAFFQLGLTDEAHQFFHWMVRSGIAVRGAPLDNLYSLDGKRNMEERELRHLAGYRDSKPVRLGNGAAQQLQLDVYGEVLDSAYLFARFGGEISRRLWKELNDIVELAIAKWELPDASIWEVRGDDQHFTYSKMMCWVAVDRGLRIAERFGLPYDAPRWRSARRAIHRRVLSEGWNASLGSFTQTLGGSGLDAALLRMSQVRFLSTRDPRLRSTMRALATRLRDGELLRRYRLDETDDGLPGEEGAFLMCSFWLADALAHIGELEQAQRHFEQLLTFASPLGLLAEECDGRTGELLGNFPQAFTHLSLVGAAVNIERARHRTLAVKGLKRR